MNSEEAGVSLVSVACRSTSCRPEVPRVSYAYPGEPDSHTHAVLFLAAEDHPLPAFDFKTFIASSAE